MKKIIPLFVIFIFLWPAMMACNSVTFSTGNSTGGADSGSNSSGDNSISSDAINNTGDKSDPDESPNPTATTSVYFNSKEFILPLVPEMFDRLGYSMTNSDTMQYIWIGENQEYCTYEVGDYVNSTSPALNIRFKWFADDGLSFYESGEFFSGQSFIVQERDNSTYRGLPIRTAVFSGGDEPENLGKIAFIKIDEKLWFGFVTTQTCSAMISDLTPSPLGLLDVLISILEESGWILPD